jgi:hypothetical protein
MWTPTNRPLLWGITLSLLWACSGGTESTPDTKQSIDGVMPMDVSDPSDQINEGVDITTVADVGADQGSTAPDTTVYDTGTPVDLVQNVDEGTTADLIAPPDEGVVAAPSPPDFDHLDLLVDSTRGDTPVWLSLIYVQEGLDGPEFHSYEYGNSGDQFDYWPASVIKLYTVTAALELVKSYGLTIDASAAFYHDAGNGWTYDTTRTIRELIHGVFNCSSNSTYTLLLRFAGLDWINTEFFTPEKGFNNTTLMRGYVLESPWVYTRTQPQRIVLSEGDASVERVHEWSGTSYADLAGCSIYNETGTANCSSPDDMVEHVRRLIFHESLPPSERFDVHQDALDWVRYGGPDPEFKNTVCAGPAYDGIARTFPNADYYHKGGLVTDYALDLHYVDDAASGTRYIAAIATESTSQYTQEMLSEDIATMVKYPDTYIHLENLPDWVNPVTADALVVNKTPGILDLVVRDFELSSDQPESWEALAGSEVYLNAGTQWLSLESSCLTLSLKYHIRARFRPDDGSATAFSDYHYVIVDADQACTP